LAEIAEKEKQLLQQKKAQETKWAEIKEKEWKLAQQKKA
jgi:hypothetical protein